MVQQSPIIYVCSANFLPVEEEGFITDHSVDEETGTWYYYSSQPNGTEILLTDEFLLEELDVNFEVVRKALFSLIKSSDKQIYVDNITHPLVKYKAQLELNQTVDTLPLKLSSNSKDLTPLNYAKKAVSSSKIVNGPFQALLNNIDTYQFKHHLDMKPSYWVNKSGNFYITSVHNPAAKEIELDPDLDNLDQWLDYADDLAWEWGVLQGSESNFNITEKQIIDIQELSKQELYPNIQIAKQRAMEAFEQVLGIENMENIKDNLTSYHPVHHSHVPLHSEGMSYDVIFPHPDLGEGIFTDFKLCQGISGKYKLDPVLKETIKNQLPQIKIPDTFKSRKSIIRFITNIISTNLDQLYNAQDYQQAQKLIEEESVKIQYWWVYFLKTEINLQDIFGT